MHSFASESDILPHTWRSALYCIALCSCLALHCIACKDIYFPCRLHRIVLHCIALHCIAFHVKPYTPHHRLHRVELHAIVFYRIALDVKIISSTPGTLPAKQITVSSSQLEFLQRAVAFASVFVHIFVYHILEVYIGRTLVSSRKSVHERPRNSDGWQVKWSVFWAIWLKSQDP